MPGFKRRSLLLQRHHGAAGPSLTQPLAQPTLSSLSPSISLQSSYKLSKSDSHPVDTTHTSTPGLLFTWVCLPSMLFSQTHPAKTSYPPTSIPSQSCSGTFLMQLSLTSMSLEPQWHLVSLLQQPACFSDAPHVAAHSWVAATSSPDTEESTLHITDTQQIFAESSRCCTTLLRRSLPRNTRVRNYRQCFQLYKYFKELLML